MGYDETISVIFQNPIASTGCIDSTDDQRLVTAHFYVYNLCRGIRYNYDTVGRHLKFDAYDNRHQLLYNNGHTTTFGLCRIYRVIPGRNGQWTGRVAPQKNV